MALKFVEELPARKGRSGSTVFTDEVIAELKKNTNKWAEIEVSTATASKFVSANDGFAYTTRTVGKDKDDKSIVKVYVAYSPKGNIKK